MGIVFTIRAQHYTALYGEDPNDVLSYAAWARSLLGCPDQVLHCIRDALTLVPSGRLTPYAEVEVRSTVIRSAASGYSICPC